MRGKAPIQMFHKIAKVVIIDSMSILITGASGYLGGGLMQQLSNEFELIGWQNTARLEGLSVVNLLNHELVAETISQEKPETIIHCAAMIDGCEEDSLLAHRINVEATRNLAVQAEKLSVPLIYVSSAAVFDGVRGTFSENSLPKPTSMYGLTKYKGEIEVQNAQTPTLILRPSFLVGMSATGQHRFYPRTVFQLQSGDEITIDNEWNFTPSSIQHISQVIRMWLKKPRKDLLHVSVPHIATKYSLMRDIAIGLRISPDLIKPKQFLTITEGGAKKEFPSRKEKVSTPLNLLESEKLKELGFPTLTYEKMISLLVDELIR